MTTRQPTPGVHENFASEISSSPDPQSQKWCPWNGGDMPVPQGTAVEVILRYGKQVVEQAGGGYATRWSHDGPMGGHDDIVFYRLYIPSPQSHVLPPVVTGQMEIQPDVAAADLGANAEPDDDDACPVCGGSGRVGPFFPSGRSTVCGNCSDQAAQAMIRTGGVQ
ncbi:hypothetical protein ACWGPT_06945 [Pseudorhizobium sp. NPDC055634]